MQRDEHLQTVVTLLPAPALACDRHLAAEQRARRSGAERDRSLRPDQRDLAFQPVQAGRRLALRRRLVDAPLAAQLELEMLDRVGEVELIAAPAELRQRAVEQGAGRADEGTSAQILLVARLLADQHQARIRRALAGHRLSRLRADRAGAAAFLAFAQGGQRVG